MKETKYFPEKAVDYLQSELEARKARRPQYSLRAFARDLELSPSTVSELFQGKVGLSKARAEIVAKRINLPQIHCVHFCDLMVASYARSPVEKKAAQIRARARTRSVNGQISLDQFKVISDWQHFAILELIELDKKFHSKQALAKSLGLSQAVVSESIARLLRLELLRETPEFYVAVSGQTTVGEQVSSSALQAFHRQLLTKAQEALISQDVSDREFQSTVFSIRKSDIPLFKKDLEKTRAELVDKYFHRDQKDSLYCFALQLFRLNQESL